MHKQAIITTTAAAAFVWSQVLVEALLLNV